MRLIPRCFAVVVLVGCLVAAVAVAEEQEALVNPPWCEGPKGLYKGRQLTPEELEAVLGNHQAWLASDRKQNDTRRANLCQADLRGANLQETNLSWADLRGANFQETNLSRANLQAANLYGAFLQGANLERADLQMAYLVGANLQRAHLFFADLPKADLQAANLQGAFLFFADLQMAYLVGTNLQEANLQRANLQGAVYEPNPEKLPRFWTLTHPYNNLGTLVFQNSPAALIALREAFKKGGMRTQERQLTYAIERTKQLQAWGPSWHKLFKFQRGDPSWLRLFQLPAWDPSWRPILVEEEDTRPWLEQLAGKSESLFNYVLFELPSGYGMVPSRALAILGLLILGFSLVYMVALLTACGRAGIWATWPTDRVYQEEGGKETTRVTTTFFFPRWQARAAGHWWGVLLRGVSVPLIGLYFSLLSAFSLGWRELNVGTWIARVQTREYVLRATGGVRMVSGIQSLLSVYLLALWVLTYFGRPFE